MALNPTPVSYGSRFGNVAMTMPVSVTLPWVEIVSIPGPALQDAATITNPTTEIVRSSTAIFDCGSIGTHLLLRLGYDRTLSVSADCIVKVFGRTGSADAWQLLKNVNGGEYAALTTSATDSDDGVYKYTIVDPTLQAWDRLGCKELLVGIETALNGTIGSAALSFIQAKMI